MKTRISIAALFIFLCISGFAQTKDSDRTLSPYFEIIGDDQKPGSFPLRSTSAIVEISGVIATVKVTQVYSNAGSKPIEAIYVFPGSTRAAVHAMRMTVGARVIEAKIRQKDQARQEYEQARQQGQSASLLEQKRPNVFQMNVANIMPGDLITVEMDYTEMLLPEEGTYQFVYPTVVGPRYSNGSEGPATPAGAGWVHNPYTSEGVAPAYDFDIRVNVNAGMPIGDLRCKSHEVAVNWTGNGQVRLDLKESERKGGNRDYVLEYRLRGGKVQSGLLLFEGKSENFFMAMIQPPKAIRPEVIPPREYIFIVDVSGSMSGFPIEVSKALLNDLIASLRPGDRFNVMLFASDNSILSETSLPANTENIKKALTLISGQRGGGGTELLPALKRALAMSGTEDFARSFVIVTDGYISVEQEAFDLIRNNLGKANFFPFGIGSSVNRHLLEGMAHVGKGEAFIVLKPADAKEIAAAFREYIQYPVLTNINVRFEGFGAYDVEPGSIPDVLSDRPVMLIGKWKGEPSGRLVVEGITGEGKYSQAFEIASMRDKGSDNSALRYLWARERIRLIDDYASLGSERPQHAEEVTKLGLTYNLLTRFTSFVAVDSEVRNINGQMQTVVQPLPLPQGVSNNATGNIVSAGATYKSSIGVHGSREAMLVPSQSYNSTPEVSSDMLGKVRLVQDEEKEEDEGEEIFIIVENMPEFIGGELRLKEFLKNNFRYPEELKVTGITGRIMISFSIGADGRVSDIKVLRGLHPLLDQEAMRVVRLTSGQWNPGMQRGKAVRVAYVLPVDVVR